MSHSLSCSALGFSFSGSSHLNCVPNGNRPTDIPTQQTNFTKTSNDMSTRWAIMGSMTLVNILLIIIALLIILLYFIMMRTYKWMHRRLTNAIGRVAVIEEMILSGAIDKLTPNWREVMINAPRMVDDDGQ